jgi:hypothetical protein
MTTGRFIVTFDPAQIGTSRFLPTRFHAHLVLGLASRAGIILHASGLLLAAHLAARLGLHGDIEPATASQQQHHHRKASDHTNSSRSLFSPPARIIAGRGRSIVESAQGVALGKR